MGKFMDGKRRQWAFVEAQIGGGRVICSRCGCTLGTFAEDCDAELEDPCPGFKLVDEAKSAFYRQNA
jgi:hypothetical protein